MTDDATLSDFLETAADDTDAGDDSDDGPVSVDGNGDGDRAENPDSRDRDATAAVTDGAETGDSSDGDDGGGNAEGEPIDVTESDDSGLSTYAWGEYACGRCGADTERVWREEGALVCPDCKSW